MSGQKRVRFDFSTISGGPSLEELSGESETEQDERSSSLTTSNSTVGQRAVSAAKTTASVLSPRNLFSIRRRRRRASISTPESVSARKRLPTSITFPMSRKPQAEEGFDFGEPPEKEASKSKEQREAEAKACIRRLSLKEFSGLDPHPKPVLHQQYATSYASPLMTRLPRASIATESYGNLLDNYSTHRRRSTASLNRIGLSCFGNGMGSRENIYDYFDKAISECSASVCASPARVAISEEPTHAVPANTDFALLYERNRLRATLDSMPSASPKRQHSVEAEKAALLRELSRLATACKNMVRAVSSYPPPTKAELFAQCFEAVESADHVTGVAENLIVKSNSLFQAQLMNAKTEQMLKALFETASDVERTCGAIRPTGEARKAIKSSTTLAATLTQLIHSVRGV